MGDALANTSTLVDGLIVIGGGLAGAAELFLPRIVEEMNSKIETYNGNRVDRMESKAYNLEDSVDLERFIKGEVREIKVPRTAKTMLYDPQKRVGVGISRLGTSRGRWCRRLCLCLACTGPKVTRRATG